MPASRRRGWSCCWSSFLFEDFEGVEGLDEGFDGIPVGVVRHLHRFGGRVGAVGGAGTAVLHGVLGGGVDVQVQLVAGAALLDECEGHHAGSFSVGAAESSSLSVGWSTVAGSTHM